MMGTPRSWTVSCCLTFLVVAGCAGYQIGTRSLYPPGIETVYVPMFQSSSFRPDLGERLTEAVVREIQQRTPLRVVSDPNADTVLTGRITTEAKHLLVEARTGDPRELQVNLAVVVTWTDRRGNVLRQCPPVPIPPACVTVQGSSDIMPEVGQSIATGQQKAIQRMAEQIVSLMEAPW